MAINEKGGNLYRPSRLTRDLAGSASASALLTGTASVTWRSAALAALLPDLCTEFGLEGDCLLNFGHPRFCRIGFMRSTESLPL